jgi:hypothetical protein
MRTSTRVLMDSTILSLATVVLYWQFRHPVVRTSSTLVNEGLGLFLALGLPWLALLSLTRLKRWWGNAIVIAGIFPLLFYSGLVFFVAMMQLGAMKNGRDLSFEPLSERQWNGSHVRFYRTNGGATTDYGLVIRQERAILPGVLLVRRLDDFYPCYSVDAREIDEGVQVEDAHGSCPGFSQRPQKYRLKRFVYF